ncbi:hypothetical protein FBU30_009544 [Linnemannia zychae]|nr:hypothetical protein FBU30_009544 [Linnemannia zychae]
MTCHYLREILIPVLWRNVELYSDDKRVKSSVQQLVKLGKKAKFVSKLSLSQGYLVGYMNRLVRSCSNGNTELGPPPWLSIPDPSVCLPVKSYPMNHLTHLDYSAGSLHGYAHIAHIAGFQHYFKSQDMFLICWLMSMNPGLTKVTLRSVHLVSSLEFRVLARAIRSLIHLTHLHIESMPGKGVYSQIYWTLFLSCSLKLESFIIRPKHQYDDFAPQLTPGSKDSDATLGPLQLYSDSEPRLNMKHCVLFISEHIDLSLYSRILRLCPRLKELELVPGGMRESDFRTIAPWVQQSCEGITAVRVQQAMAFMVEDQVMQMLAGIQAPRNKLSIFHYDQFEDPHQPFLDMIHQHHQTLREVRLTNARTVNSSGIRDLLTTCAGLEILDVTNDEGPTGIARIEDLVAQPWICRKLRQLQIRVAWGEFEDKQPYYLQDSSTVVSPRDFERWILLEKFYFQIGSMTKLEILGLRPYLSYSVDDFSEDELYDGIEEDMADKAVFPQLLTLGNKTKERVGYLNYLYRLKNLRELRGSFNVFSEEISATFGQPEVEWIAQHWPQLEIIELIPPQPKKPKRVNGKPHINWLIKRLPKLDVRQQSFRPKESYDEDDSFDTFHDFY